MSQPNSSGAVVIDSNVLISICSKENSYSTAKQALADYSAKNWVFYAPGVIVSEVLFVLCRKLSDGSLTAAAYDDGIELLKDQLTMILPPPRGDAALVQRSREIQTGYSCLHSADCLYVALAEELAASGAAEFVTFDKRVGNVAAKNAPTVRVNLLPA
ncbi:MAG: type II toxin-antitoxin system VapC family toxin [Blastocatellia bacterium]